MTSDRWFACNFNAARLEHPKRASEWISHDLAIDSSMPTRNVPVTSQAHDELVYAVNAAASRTVDILTLVGRQPTRVNHFRGFKRRHPQRRVEDTSGVTRSIA